MESSGSESMACNKILIVNVGDPIFSLYSYDRVLADKYKSKGAKKEYRKSDGSY
jgi:hypothetical protein